MRGNSNIETAGRLRWRRVAVVVLASAAVVGGPSAAQAATWWRNTTTTGLWSDTALWSNAASGGTTGAPVNDTTTDVVVFNQTAVTGNTVVTLDAATSITGITVGNSGLTALRSSDATARTLSIGASGITANAGSGGLTIGTSGSLVGVAITANQTWTNNAASPITVAGNLSGSATLTKAGTGTLAFSGASTHSGTFTINAGTVQLGNTGTSSLSRVVMANTAGATLQLTGSAATLRSISGSGASGGNVDLGSAMLTLQNDVGTDYGGVMSGSGGVIKAGGANTGFRFTAQQAYTGPTVVLANWLVTLTDNAIASTAYVQTDGGILDISNRPQTIGGLTGASGGVHSFTGSGGTGGSLTLNVASGTSYTYAGNIGSSLAGFPLIKAGGGTQILTASNSYTGATTVSAGRLVLGHANALGSTAQGTTVADGGSLGVQGGITVAESLSISGTGFGGAGALVNISGSNTFSGTVTLGSDARVGALDGALTLSAPVGGGFGLTKVGPGTVILSASNGYTGGTTISEGTLQINQTGVIGGGPVVNNATLALNSTAGNVFFSNNISGTGGLSKSSGGAVYLTGTNTYSGTTTITGGYLVAGSTTGLSASSVVVTAGGILDIAQRAVTIGGLSGSTDSVHSFPGTGGQGALTLAVASGTVTYGGQVGGAYPNLALAKTGLGTQILSGSSNYSGNTAVDVGTLLVNGAVGSGTVTVASVAILGGSGTIGGPVAVLGGGILAPGTSPGTLTVNNSLTLANTSILEFELNPANFTIGGGVNDLITGVTALALDGVLNVSGAGDWTTVPNNSSWRLFNYSGALTNNVLTFGSMPTLATGQSFQINTATPGQIDLVIVPEPGALALAAAGVGLAATWAVRRRSK